MGRYSAIDFAVDRSVRRAVMESERRGEEMADYERELCRELFGTDTFEEFYGNTGFWVGARSYALMKEYFARMEEHARRLERGEL